MYTSISIYIDMYYSSTICVMNTLMRSGLDQHGTTPSTGSSIAFIPRLGTAPIKQTTGCHL